MIPARRLEHLERHHLAGSENEISELTKKVEKKKDEPTATVPFK